MDFLLTLNSIKILPHNWITSSVSMAQTWPSSTALQTNN